MGNSGESNMGIAWEGIVHMGKGPGRAGGRGGGGIRGLTTREREG